MISLISHLSLGLLLGALCGVGMSSARYTTVKLMTRICVLSGGLFMISALASKLLSEGGHSVELLADVVMTGVAGSLLITLVSLNVSKLPQRSIAGRARGLQS